MTVSARGHDRESIGDSKLAYVNLCDRRCSTSRQRGQRKTTNNRDNKVQMADVNADVPSTIELAIRLGFVDYPVQAISEARVMVAKILP